MCDASRKSFSFAVFSFFCLEFVSMVIQWSCLDLKMLLDTIFRHVLWIVLGLFEYFHWIGTRMSDILLYNTKSRMLPISVLIIISVSSLITVNCEISVTPKHLMI